MQRLGRAKQRYARAARHYQVEITQDASGTKVSAITWTQRVKPGSAVAHPGVYCLRTTLVGQDNATLWRLIQDAARFDGVRRAAARAGLTVLLQRAQLAEALADMPDVFVEQGVDLSAVLRRRVAQTQPRTDLVERHVQVAAVADECPPIRMCGGVQVVVVFSPLRRREQALSLVQAEADRFLCPCRTIPARFGGYAQANEHHRALRAGHVAR